MKDTRETRYGWDSGKTAENTSPRFKVGDKVLIPHNGGLILREVLDVYWDKEFGGWLVCCCALGIHEQNFILESEKEDWVPHEHGLWSWWERER